MNERHPCACPYCGSPGLRRTHAGLSNRFKPDHGPFDFLRCLACGSGTTRPVPSPDELRSLYASFVDGMPASLRSIMPKDASSSWHELPVKRIGKLAALKSDSVFSWHDVGAGAGEMARLMSAAFPMSNGMCTDLHERPAALAGPLESIVWTQVDLNDDDFARGARLADVVHATAIWEHVRSWSATVFPRWLSLPFSTGALETWLSTQGSPPKRRARLPAAPPLMVSESDEREQGSE